jgi:SAM-dependent methyltransferase
VEAGAERPEAEAASADRLRRASSFGAVAAQYAQHRPSYAEAAIRWCLAAVSRAQPVRVVDLGAGTGILTGALARLGADVVAVEPDQAMLAELHRRLPGVRATEGSAEAIPLPDRSVDDDRVGWVAELAAISQSGATLSRWRATPEAGTEQDVLRAGSSWFAPVEEREFGNGQLRSADSLVAAMATNSRMLVMPEADRARTLSTIRDLLDRQPETSAGEFTLPLVTVALRAVRRP